MAKVSELQRGLPAIGTSFPAAPVTGSVFVRSDLEDRTFTYTGTEWLTRGLHRVIYSSTNNSQGNGYLKHGAGTLGSSSRGVVLSSLAIRLVSCTFHGGDPLSLTSGILRLREVTAGGSTTLGDSTLTTGSFESHPLGYTLAAGSALSARLNSMVGTLQRPTCVVLYREIAT